MNKAEIMQRISAQLSHDLEVLYTAAKTAHKAATHAENIAENKYDTLALEASYVAQGQANRARRYGGPLRYTKYKNKRLKIHLRANKYPPAQPGVLRLLPPQRGLTAIGESQNPRTINVG